jgi:hypothetical protein
MEPCNQLGLAVASVNLRVEKRDPDLEAIDTVNERIGKHKISLGTGLFLGQHRKPERDIVP